MASAAETIVGYVMTQLKVPPMASVPAARVFRDLMDALRSESMPAIAVEAGGEEPPSRSLIQTKDRRLELNVTVLAKGTAPYTQADAAVVESFGRITADLNLGGLSLDVIEGPTRRQREGLSEDIGAVTKTYIVEYRTAEGAI